jgi:LysM repeat protein
VTAGKLAKDAKSNFEEEENKSLDERMEEKMEESGGDGKAPSTEPPPKKFAVPSLSEIDSFRTSTVSKEQQFKSLSESAKQKASKEQQEKKSSDIDVPKVGEELAARVSVSFVAIF